MVNVNALLLALFGTLAAPPSPGLRLTGPDSPAVEITWTEDLAHGGVAVKIKNTHKVALEAWQITVVYSTLHLPKTSVTQTEDTYALLATGIQRAGEGPIQPKELRSTLVRVPDVQVVRSVRLDFALFEDMSFEGPNVKGKEAVLARRDAKAEALNQWITVLKEIEGAPLETGRRLLAAKLADPSQARSSVADSVRQALPVSYTLDDVAMLRENFERQRDLARRHKVR